MDKFKIADLVIDMQPQHAPLKPQSEAYRYFGNEESVCTVITTPDDVKNYQDRYHSDDLPLIEYMHTGSVFYTNLLMHNGMLLHASAVELDGKAYLFSAPSGTGKSTHTSLWVSEFSPNAKILNDDKPAIRFFDDEVYVYGTPWSGKTDLNLNHKVKLQGIAFIERGQTNDIRPMQSILAIENILSQTVRPHNRELMSTLLDNISRLIQKVPVYKLRCNMDPEAAHVSYHAMNKGEIL